MKVTFLGSSSSLDNEICYIHGLQERGISLQYFFCNRENINPLFRLEKEYPIGIIPASEIQEMHIYKKYIKLDGIYMVNAYKLRFRSPKLWFLYFQVIKKIKKFNPDIIHHAWPWVRVPALTYLLNKKMSMFVHDPIPHSSNTSKIEAFYRRLGFKRANKLILLNNKTTKEFCDKYSISPKKISFSNLCIFDYLDIVKYIPCNEEKKYILFFGQIASYKGLDLLLNAMTIVHQSHANWKLIVAGGGNMYFDISSYKKLDYIEIRNRFIDIPELVGLIKGCEFVVAPYRDATQSGVVNNTLSLNKPIIVSRVGNFEDEVINDITGIVVNPNSVNELVEAINKMIENDSLRSDMGHNISKEWRNNRDNMKIISGLIDIFDDTINES